MMHSRSDRILLVARGLDPVGTGRQVELLAAGLRGRGWDVQVAITTAGGSVATRLAARGIPVHLIGSRPVIDVAVAARLVRLVGRLRPTVVHASGRSCGQLGLAVRPLLGAGAFLCQLAVSPRPTGLIRRLLRRADRVIAVSSGVAAACRAAGVGESRIDVVPPGIEAFEGEHLAREAVAVRLGLRAASPWTLCLAPLTAEARLERLIWAIDQLDVVRRGVEHILVGSGPLLARVLRRARVQQLAERLHLMPDCDCLPDLLRQVQLVWQSGNVAYGGAILDAMPYGIPAVAVESDAARQLIVDDSTGRIVTADPESEFPRRAFNILEDDALAARYAAAARIRAAEEFSAATSVARHLDVIERRL